jgi:hypothetical protein
MAETLGLRFFLARVTLLEDFLRVEEEGNEEMEAEEERLHEERLQDAMVEGNWNGIGGKWRLGFKKG